MVIGVGTGVVTVDVTAESRSYETTQRDLFVCVCVYVTCAKRRKKKGGIKGMSKKGCARAFHSRTSVARAAITPHTYTPWYTTLMTYPRKRSRRGPNPPIIDM